MIISFYFSHEGRRNAVLAPIEASYTPASEFILSGSSDGQVHFFKSKLPIGDKNSKAADLQSNLSEAITDAKLNPKYLMMATASSSTGIWLPKNHY